jgi:hypothetical protein
MLQPPSERNNQGNDKTKPMKNVKTHSWIARLSTGFGVVLAAGLTLFGPGGSGPQCLAGYAGGPADEPTTSFGAFQIQVSPNFTNLFYPTNTSGGNAYPGFSPSSGILTSPVGYDPATMIGISGPQKYAYVGQTTPPFPVTVGGGPPVMYPPINVIQNMNDYYAVPSDATIPNDPWVFPSPNTTPDEIFTEIEAFDLIASTGAFECGDARVPGASVNIDMLTAGPNAGPGGSVNYPNYVTDQGLRSIGKVQQYLAGDYPGASFFNIYVNVFLPSVAGTYSDSYFPGSTLNPTPPPPWPVAYPYPFGVAQLTNGVADPLVIEDTNVTSLPPHVVYIHGQTPAVPLHFKYDNKPYWNAGDLLGYITLAGHGVLGCTNDSTGGGQGETNCCAVVTELLDATFGPTNAPIPSMAVGYPETTDTLPPPGRALGSLQNVVVQDGVTNDLSDSLSFQFGVGEVVTISHIILNNISNSVAPPAPNTVATINDTNIGVNFTLAFNGTAPVSCVGTGVLSMSISNNGVANPKIYYGTNQPGYTSYTVQLMQLTAPVVSGAGRFFIQVDPSATNESLGMATIADVAGGYNVSFVDDAHLMLGTSPSDYMGSISNRTIRLYRSMSPATPVVPYIVPTYSLTKPSQVVLKWPGSGTLQSTPSLSGAIQWTDITSSNTYAPYAFTINTNHMFFRLKQP